MANVNRVVRDFFTAHVRNPDSLGQQRVLYTPLGGTARHIGAIVHLMEGDQRTNEADGQITNRMAEISVAASDVEGLLVGDSFQIEGIDFIVAHIPSAKSFGLTTIALEGRRYLDKSDGGIQRVGR